MHKTGEIRSLTGIRGLAACFVMAYHYFKSPIDIGTGSNFLRHGFISVDLFFVLSGFVMALTYGRTFSAQLGLKDYLSFLYKRLGRVYPLYIVATVFIALWGLFRTGHGPGAFMFVCNALLIQAWGLADSIGGPTWSISTEFAAYVIFPILTITVLSGPRSLALATGALAVAALVLVATRSAPDLHQVFDGIADRNGPLDAWGIGTLYPVLRCLGGFVLGMLAFRMAQSPAIKRPASWRFSADVLLVTILLLLAIPGSDLALVILFVPLIIALAMERSFSARILGSPILYWLGLVSYSIYLVHRVADDVFRSPLKAALIRFRIPHAYTVSGLITVAATLLLSTTTYYLIEKPARDGARRLLGRRPVSMAAAEPAAP